MPDTKHLEDAEDSFSSVQGASEQALVFVFLVFGWLVGFWFVLFSVCLHVSEKGLGAQLT